MSEFLSNLDFLNFYKNFLWEDLIVIFFMYNFVKYLFIFALIELVWPTQFFNKRHNIGTNVIRFRTYSETALKLFNQSSYFSVFNFFFFKLLFL